MYTLYGYWRSSASYRVRIALNLKDLDYTQQAVHLVRDGGEQHQPDFLARNPHGLVPVLEVDGLRLTQSMAILEYLEERHPEPALLPADPADRAWVRAVAQTIGCEIHPLNNLRVLKYLGQHLGIEEQARLDWYRRWLKEGLDVVETHLERLPGPFSLGERPGYLEACLVPQIYNARRFEFDLTGYPRMTALDARCRGLQAFQNAAPENQPDAT